MKSRTITGITKVCMINGNCDDWFDNDNKVVISLWMIVVIKYSAGDFV